MEVLLPPNEEARLAALAAQTGRAMSDLVQEAVSKLLSGNDWFQQQVQVGMDQIARGDSIEEDEMDARVERMLHS